MNNVLEFDGIVDFSAFINPLAELKKEIPQLSVATAIKTKGNNTQTKPTKIF